ncbi:MAG: energy transducer TonB [Campylobacterota bacterium]|nr:energy transducer TonB [Campylobacterota bacterium]
MLSLLLTAFAFYTLFKSSNYITISPELPRPLKVQERVVSITIEPASVVKKQEVKVVKPRPIKKIIKKKIVKKVIPVKTKPVVVPVVEPMVKPVTQPIERSIIETTIEPVVQKIQLPVFDAQMKASFIAGLYEMLNEKKYYPKMAKRRKLEGIAEVSFTLCKDGTIRNIFLHKSCGHKILDRAALKVVKSIDVYKAIPDAVSMASLNLNIPIKYSRN